MLIAIGLFAIIIPFAVFFALEKWKTMRLKQMDVEEKERQRLALEERKRGPSDPGCEKECARNGFCKVNTAVVGHGRLFGRCCVTNTTSSSQECGAMSDTMIDDDVRKRAAQEYINKIPPKM